MPVTLTYDKRACGRCGGSGYFRCWSHIAGGACFKCHGRGYALTAAGKRASAAIGTFIKDTFSVPIAELKPGDRVLTKSGLKRTVKEVSDLSVRYTKIIENLHGIVLIDTDTWGAGEDAKLVVRPSGANWEKVVAFARTLKLKGLTIVETPDTEAA